MPNLSPTPGSAATPATAGTSTAASSGAGPARRVPGTLWWGLGLVFLGLLVVWVLSPWWAIARMHQALEARDAAAFSVYIDYPAVRESLKPVITARVKNEITEQMGHFGAASAGLAMNGLVEQIAGAAVATAVDTAVTPAGLMALMVGTQAKDAVGKVTAAGDGPGPAAVPSSSTGALPANGDAKKLGGKLQFHGGYLGSVNRFGVSLVPLNGGEIRFVMQRRGFATWRLIEVVPPEA